MPTISEKSTPEISKFDWKALTIGNIGNTAEISGEKQKFFHQISSKTKCDFEAILSRISTKITLEFFQRRKQSLEVKKVVPKSELWIDF